jgi:hypothetical protein
VDDPVPGAPPPWDIDLVFDYLSHAPPGADGLVAEHFMDLSDDMPQCACSTT